MQYCRAADGSEPAPARWTLTPANPAEAGAEESPHVVVLPARKPGWNKLTVAKELTDLTVFDDAQIVWAGRERLQLQSDDHGA